MKKQERTSFVLNELRRVMIKRNNLKTKFGELGRLGKQAGYSWELITEAIEDINIQKDKEAALDYILDFARRKVNSEEFFTAVMDLTMDEKTHRMRFKFGDGGVAELVQVAKPLDEE